MEGLIITIIAIAAFVGIGLFMAIKGPKPRIPKGRRFNNKDAHGNKAIIVVDKDIPTIKDKDTGDLKAFLSAGEVVDVEKLKESCVRAMRAAEEAFDTIGLEKANKDEVVFWFLSSKEFNTHYNGYMKKAAAYSTTTGAMIGSGLPMAVIRDKHLTTVATKGQPAIHELVHILNKDVGRGYDHDHSEDELWKLKDSANKEGQRRWQELEQNKA